MTRREAILTVTLTALLGGLALGTTFGRAFLIQPIDMGVSVPRWMVGITVALAYAASLSLPIRWLRVAIAYGLAHAVIPAQVSTPLPWYLLKELALLALVLLHDLHLFPSHPVGPQPRHWPATALRHFRLSRVAAMNDRRRLRRAQ